MRIFHSPAALIAALPSAGTVAGVGSALTGLSSIGGLFLGGKTPKAPNADKQLARENAAAREEAQKQRSLLAQQNTTEQALRPLSNVNDNGLPATRRRSLLGI